MDDPTWLTRFFINPFSLNYTYVRKISSKAAPLPDAVTPEVAGRGGVERAVGGTGSLR